MINVERFNGYSYEDAMLLGEKIFGHPMFTRQDVLDELDHCWSIDVAEAKCLQGASSNNTIHRNHLYVIREWCYVSDQASLVDTTWYDQNMQEQQHVEKLCDHLWMQAVAEEEAA